MNDYLTYQPPLPLHLDYDQLRARGLARLQELAGARWTDHNTHDPGITILEALCYALTELGYRAGYPLPDLLGDKKSGLYDTVQALTNAVVSPNDMRDMLLRLKDLAIAEAWWEAADSGDEKPLYYHPSVNAIGYESAPGVQTLELRGLYQAAVARLPYSVDETNDIEIKQKIDTAIQANRNICTDLIRATELAIPQSVVLDIQIELDPSVSDPMAVAVRCLVALAQAIAPPAPEGSFSRAVSPSAQSAEKAPLRGGGDNLYASDLVQVLADVAGVRFVRSLYFSDKKWVLSVLPRRLPVLNLGETVLQFNRETIKINFWETETEKANIIQKVKDQLKPKTQTADLPTTSVSNPTRQLTDYYSIRHHFPAIYGLGEEVPQFEQTERVASIRQMSAFLVFFEQFLAGGFAQLTHARTLFDINTPLPTASGSTISISYQNPSLRTLPNVDSLLKDTYELVLTAQTQDSDRISRLYNHLLARFGEQMQEIPNEAKRYFLQNWVALSRNRGLGFDYTKEKNVGGLEARIRALLALKPEERFLLIENILFRPLPQDEADDDGFWLTDLPETDPWSLRLTVVLSQEERFNSTVFMAQAKRLIRQETPAHIALEFLELDKTRFDKMNTAYTEWQKALKDKNSADKSLAKLRVTRDAVTDQLYQEVSVAATNKKEVQFLIGWTPPILDIRILPVGFVDNGEQATIVLQNSQIGVYYVLRDRYGKPLLSKDGKVILDDAQQPFNFVFKGNGQPELIFKTHKLSEDIVFRIEAIKLLPNETVGDKDPLSVDKRRSGFLKTRVWVKVGIRDNVGAKIVRPLKQEELDYGQRAIVTLSNIQAEIEYYLVDAASPKNNYRFLSKKFSGQEGGFLNIESDAIRTDVALIVLAQRQVGDFPKQKEIPIRIDDDNWNQVWVKPKNLFEFKNFTTHVLDSGKAMQVALNLTEKTVKYQLIFRTIADNEINPMDMMMTQSQVFFSIPNDAKPTEAKSIQLPSLENMRNVRWAWQQTEEKEGTGLDDFGNTGEALLFDMPDIVEDTFIYIRSYQEHRANGEIFKGKPIISGSFGAFGGRQVTALFVRPRTEGITITLVSENVAQGERIGVRCSGVQTGVKYRLVNADDPKIALSPFFYVHETRTDNPLQDGIAPVIENTKVDTWDDPFFKVNTELGSKIGIDFAIGPPQNTTDFIIQSDLLETMGPLSIQVQAEKVQTGLQALLRTIFVVNKPPSVDRGIIATEETPPAKAEKPKRTRKPKKP